MRVKLHAGHGAIDDKRRGDAVLAQAGDEGKDFPAPTAADQSFTAG